MEIALDTNEVKRLEGRMTLLPGKLKAARVSGVNKAATKTKTYVNRLVRERYNVKSKRVNKNLQLDRANYGMDNPEAMITATGRRVPLLDYGGRPAKPPGKDAYTKEFPARIKKPRKGPSVLVRKKGGRKILADAFVAKMPSGHVGIFRRKTKARLPIKELFGMSVGGMVNALKTRQSIDQYTPPLLAQELHRAVDYYLMKAGLKA